MFKIENKIDKTKLKKSGKMTGFYLSPPFKEVCFSSRFEAEIEAEKWKHGGMFPVDAEVYEEDEVYESEYDFDEMYESAIEHLVEIELDESELDQVGEFICCGDDIEVTEELMDCLENPDKYVHVGYMYPTPGGSGMNKDSAIYRKK